MTAFSATGAGALAGTVVVDLSRVLAGPYCTMMLADLGATVIKVESPGAGDEARQFLPFDANGESAYFAAHNRGKRSIALDPRQADDHSLLMQLLARADVLVENYRPGVMQRLGLPIDLLRSRFPRLVVASISGFGQTGPYRDRAAYDVIVQAMSGLASLTGAADGPPTRVGASIGDLAAALFACNGIQAALLRRARLGVGDHVDIAMLESQIALLEGALPAYYCQGAAPMRIGSRHPGTAPFDIFRASDGHLAIAAGSDHLFSALMEVLGISQVGRDARFLTRPGRVHHHALLKAHIEIALDTDTVAAWVARLSTAGVPAGPVNDVADMVRDAQVQARGLLVPIEGREWQHTPVTPVRFASRGYPARLPPVPELDADRDAVRHFAEFGTWPAPAEKPEEA